MDGAGLLGVIAEVLTRLRTMLGSVAFARARARKARPHEDVSKAESQSSGVEPPRLLVVPGRWGGRGDGLLRRGGVLFASPVEGIIAECRQRPRSTSGPTGLEVWALGFVRRPSHVKDRRWRSWSPPRQRTADRAAAGSEPKIVIETTADSPYLVGT